MKAGHVFTIEPMICEGERKGAVMSFGGFLFILVAHHHIGSCFISFCFTSTPCSILNLTQYDVENWTL